MQSARRIGVGKLCLAPFGFGLVLNLLLYRRIRGRRTQNEYRLYGAVAVLGAIRDILTCPLNKESFETSQPSNFPTEIDDVPDPQPFDHVLWFDTFCDLVEQGSILAGILGTQDRRIIEQRLKVRWNGRSPVDDREAFCRHTHLHKLRDNSRITWAASFMR